MTVCAVELSAARALIQIENNFIQSAFLHNLPTKEFP